MSLYYQYMEAYMGPAVFAVSDTVWVWPILTSSLLHLQITREAMKSPHDEIALQGIEFWSTVCDEEQDLALEAAEVGWSQPCDKLLVSLSLPPSLSLTHCLPACVGNGDGTSP